VSEGEPQSKSNLVQLRFKICHLVAGYDVGLQYAVKKYWYGKCIVCPTNPTIVRRRRIHGCRLSAPELFQSPLGPLPVSGTNDHATSRLHLSLDVFSGGGCLLAQVTGQLADKPTRGQSSRGLDSSRTGQLAEMFDLKCGVYNSSKLLFHTNYTIYTLPIFDRVRVSVRVRFSVQIKYSNSMFFFKIRCRRVVL